MREHHTRVFSLQISSRFMRVAVALSRKDFGHYDPGVKMAGSDIRVLNVWDVDVLKPGDNGDLFA